MTENRTCGCTPECAIQWGTCHCGCGTPTRIAPQTSTDRGWVRGQPIPYRKGHAPRKINHVLTGVDEVKRTATCSRCGLVSVKRNGESGWRCHRGLIAIHKIVDVDEGGRVGFCRACNERVPLLRHTRDGWICKPNRDKTVSAWRDRTVDHRRETHRAWRDANRDHLRAGHLAKKYGLTVEDYGDMIKSQGGLCAICRRPPKSTHRGGMLHVDHCHLCLAVREALCGDCNMALGMFGEDVEVLLRAVDYLRQHQCPLPVASSG